MDNKQKGFELIEAYLDGDLSGEELKAFEKRLKNEPELAKEVSLHRQMAEVFVPGPFEKLIREKRQLLEHDQEPPKDSKKSTWGYMVAAAIAALIVISGIVFVTLQPAQTSEELFAEYYVPYAGPGPVRGELDSVPEEPTHTFSLYSQQDYQGALNGFEALLIQHPDHIEYKFYSGVCLLELDQTKDAKDVFQSIADLGIDYNLYYQQSLWYLAMCHIRLQQYEDAIVQLGILADMSGKYQGDAKELLDLLDGY